VKPYKKNWMPGLVYSILLVFILGFPFATNNLYLLHILILAGMWSILCVSLHLLEITGLFTLCHAAFMGIGAYASAILCMKLGWSFWAALPLAGLIAASAAVLTGSIFLRVKGLLFAIITFAFGEAVMLAFSYWPGLGGKDGLTGLPVPNPIHLPLGLDIKFAGKIPYYFLTLIIVFISVWIIYRVEKSRLGRIFSAIQANDTLTESTGVNVYGYRLLSFGIGAFFAGITGSLYGHYHSYLAPMEFGVWTSVMIFLLVVIGGKKSLLGPVIGAIFLTIVPELLRGAKMYAPLFYAVLVLVVIFFLPEGLVSLPDRIRSLKKNVQKSATG
jgi:branched-chain amino acid transport system permease protein